MSRMSADRSASRSRLADLGDDDGGVAHLSGVRHTAGAGRVGSAACHDLWWGHRDASRMACAVPGPHPAAPWASGLLAASAAPPLQTIACVRVWGVGGSSNGVVCAELGELRIDMRFWPLDPIDEACCGGLDP